MSEWIRVTREDRCPICQKDSWCTYNSDVVICMRVQGGKEKTFRDGSVGWIHSLSSGARNASRVDQPRRTKPEVTINAKKMMEEFDDDTGKLLVLQLAESLAVLASSLYALGCRYSKQHKAFAFPMFDGYGHTVGIRLRSLDGRKWAVKGSRQGIFMPSTCVQKLALVCEGPTDTAAALTMGFWCVGRPHCAGGLEDIRVLFRRLGVREAVIVSDRDDPGIRGATMLRNTLGIPTALLILPCKDLRQFLNKGGNQDDLNNLLTNVTWQRPK